MGIDVDYGRLVTPMQPLATGMQPAGAPRQPLSCVLLDVYGTLFISTSGDIFGTAPSMHSAGNRGGEVQAALADMGISRRPEALHSAFTAAVARDRERSRRRGIVFPEVDVLSIWQEVLGLGRGPHLRRFALVYEMAVNPVYPMPGLAHFLAASRERVTLGIVSNAQFYTVHAFRRFCGASLKDLGFDPELVFFSFIHGVAKPSPALFDKAVEALQRRSVPPEQTLYMGNEMLNDIMPAQRAGMQTALFAGDRRSLRLRRDHPACRGLAPDMVVTSLAQLAEALESC